MSDEATRPTAPTSGPPAAADTPHRLRGRRTWGWTLLALAFTWWASDTALTHLMPQTWGGATIGGGLLLLIAAGLGITGALLLLFHYSDHSHEPQI